MLWGCDMSTGDKCNLCVRTVLWFTHLPGKCVASLANKNTTRFPLDDSWNRNFVIALQIAYSLQMCVYKTSSFIKVIKLINTVTDWYACDAVFCVQPKHVSSVCRPADGPCDLAEYCDGLSHDCPSDVFVQDGTQCLQRQVWTLVSELMNEWMSDHARYSAVLIACIQTLSLLYLYDSIVW